jgi:CDP-2,3-bis-(O-geranylgeranyl)-sn-glycerol synthase
MTEFLLQSLWLLLPILAANQGPGLAKSMQLPLGDIAVSNRWLGPSKTLAAYYAGPLMATIVLYMYDPNFLVDGLVLGLGAVLGDHIKSFIKRRLGYPPGYKWWPDRIDFAIGGGIASTFLFDWVTPLHVLTIITAAWPIHVVGNLIGYYLGWRKTPH